MPAHLLEKTCDGVDAIRFAARERRDLKGRHVVDKVIDPITRVDLACDIRKLIPSLIGAGGELSASHRQKHAVLNSYQPDVLERHACRAKAATGQR